MKFEKTSKLSATDVVADSFTFNHEGPCHVASIDDNQVMVRLVS